MKANEKTFYYIIFFYLHFLLDNVGGGCYTTSTDNGVGVFYTTRIPKKGFSIKCDKVLDKCVCGVVER